MTHHFWRISACWIATFALMGGLLGGCATSSDEPGVVTGTGPASQTVSYANGQYRLYGGGTSQSPYYWVWVPNGVTAPPPPMDMSNSTVTYPGGRYQLRGSGTLTSPYYWVWVPTGAAVAATIPPPPTLPVTALPVTSASVAQPGGQYQLYGNGTPASPYYWVWVPAGSPIPPPPPPPR
jgi:hypothetical protein